MSAKSQIDWDNLPEIAEANLEKDAYAIGWFRIVDLKGNTIGIACLGKSEKERYEITSATLGAAIKKADEKADEYEFKLQLKYVKVTDNFSISDAGLEKAKCEDGKERFVIKCPLSFMFSEFSGYADFLDAQFSKNAKFSNTKFNGDAHFNHAQFRGDANFFATQFRGDAHFNHAQFNGDANFLATQFNGYTIFEGAQFVRGASFLATQFNGYAIFDNAKFGKGASFHFARFKDQLRIDTRYLKKLPWWVRFARALLQFDVDEKKQWEFWRNHPKWRAGILKLCTIYLFCVDIPDPPIDWGNVAEIDIADTYTKRIISDDIYVARFKERYPWLHKLWWLSSDFGRSFSLWAVWSSIFAFIFGCIYSYYDMLVYSSEYFRKSAELGFLQAIYFSVVTLTTLGAGDINIKPGMGQLIVSVEVVLGYVMLGGLIAIFANKIARRS